MSEWSSCADAFDAREAMNEQIVPGYDPWLFSSDCKFCGHLAVLHSRTRGCVGCRLEPEHTS